MVRKAQDRLRQLNQIGDVLELRTPPSNHFEALGADRRGQYSVRVNMQWRICFRWSDEGAEDVELVDYH